MESSQEYIFNPNKSIKLGQMKDYLKEWFQNLTQEVNKIDFEKFDKELVLKDDKEQPIFHAIFEYGQSISDDSDVFVCGIIDEELQGIIAKLIYLDELIDYSKTKKVPAAMLPQKQ